MKPSLQKIQKYLKLEADRGYDNRAVVGGLDKMLPTWEAEARAEEVSEELIQATNARIRDYPRLSPNSRAEVLEGIWRRIQRGAKVPLPPLPSSPSAESTSSSSDVAKGPTEELLAENGILGREEPVAQPPKEPDKKEKSDSEQSSIVKVTSQTTRAPAPEGSPVALSAPITVLPGVGARHAQTLKRLDLSTLRDMLYYFPRRYDDYTQLRTINRLFYGEEVTVIGTVQSVTARPIRGGHAQIVEVIISDGSGALRLTWFNQPWLGKRLQGGMHIVLSGKIEQYLGRLVMNNPEWEPLDQQSLHTNRIVPVYSLTAHITQRWLRRLMFQVVNYWAPRVQDHLPESVRRSADLPDLSNALMQVHFPDSLERLKAARERLAFDEIFLLQLGVLSQKRAWQNRTARIFETTDEWLVGQMERLPFPLTGAQKRSLDDMRADLVSGHPMNRLLQGDVGSGKTVIAALATAIIADHGSQSAFLAPTSILAEQHYQTLRKLLCEGAGGGTGGGTGAGTDQEGAVIPALKPDEIALILGATPELEKSRIRNGLASGQIKLVVGTHALIEDPITFADLQLTVIDEQHRFGVEQRALLRSKGDNPHLLVMTATPIPRSLALTIYGDLDLSIMDEMPPGRQAVETHVLYPLERERAYSLIRRQVELGHQAFIIYPLIEEGESQEVQVAGRGAVEEHTRLQNVIFPNIQVGLLHGRLKADEKESVMARFRDREIHILVSTSVVEVGVDIPNATVMLVEGANRFGLAQLHQFRGRVGRGMDQAYCLLIPEDADLIENERLSAMLETNDGFILAERDLEQRGPGDFLGTRQAGFRSELRMASLTDIHLIEKARRQAQNIFNSDPDLIQSENRLLSTALQAYWGSGEGQIKGDIS